jgi:hypothetical protein
MYERTTHLHQVLFKNRKKPPRKRTPISEAKKVMLLAFFILRVSHTTSTFTTGKQLTWNSTWRSCDVCVNQFAENNQEKWLDGDRIPHHDNALAYTSHLVQQILAKRGTAKLQQPPSPAYTSHLVQHILAKRGTVQLQQPPYTPELAPCDFLLFPRLKKVLKGHRFGATESIKRNS